MEGWVGLVGWPIVDTLPTKWSHVNHRSDVDQEGSPVKDRRSNHWATPPCSQCQHVSWLQICKVRAFRPITRLHGRALASMRPCEHRLKQCVPLGQSSVHPPPSADTKCVLHASTPFSNSIAYTHNRYREMSAHATVQHTPRCRQFVTAQHLQTCSIRTRF